MQKFEFLKKSLDIHIILTIFYYPFNPNQLLNNKNITYY